MTTHIPHFRQLTDYSCGAASLRMVLAHFGTRLSEKRLAEELGTNARTGTTRKALAAAAKSRGLAVAARHHRTIADVARDLAAGQLVIVLYREPDEDESHYAVCVRVTKERVLLHDPWHGPAFSLSRREFLRRWYGTHRATPRWAMTIGRNAHGKKRAA